MIHRRVWFYEYPASSVELVWGVNGWDSPPEECLPEGSRQVDGKTSFRTLMKRAGDFHYADIELPADFSLEFGFSILEREKMVPGLINWKPASRWNSIVIQRGSLLSFLKKNVWNLLQTARKYCHTSMRLQHAGDITWYPARYTRFIILAEARTGSTMLMALLRSHPAIKMYGELFNPRHRKKTIAALKNQNPRTLLADFLNDQIYTRYLRPYRAVGFKVFYSHRKPVWKYVWDYFQISGVSVVHLKRRNHLDRYLSSQLANRSHQWQKSRDEERALQYNAPIRLDPDDCIERIQRVIQWQQEHEALFSDNPTIEVFYEDIVRDPRSECSRILQFLEVPRRSLNAGDIQKQRLKPKTEIIANYEELRQAFEKAAASGEIPRGWLSFFEEENSLETA